MMKHKLIDCVMRYETTSFKWMGGCHCFLNLSLTCFHFETQFATLQGLAGDVI